MGAKQAADAECWKEATPKSVTQCGDLYLSEIDSVGKGIVLLHDPYFIDMNNPDSGGTYQMIEYIVPILKSKGYTFVRIDEVPDIAALLPGAKAADGGVASGSAERRRRRPGHDPATTDPNPCP